MKSNIASEFVHWLFWNGLIPFLGILLTFPISSCVRSGSLQPLLFFILPSNQPDFGFGIAIVITSIVVCINLAFGLILSSISVGLFKLKTQCLSKNMSIFRFFVDCALLPIVSTMVSTLITVSPRAHMGETLFTVMNSSFTKQGLPFAVGITVAGILAHLVRWKTKHTFD